MGSPHFGVGRGTNWTTEKDAASLGERFEAIATSLRFGLRDRLEPFADITIGKPLY